MKPRGDTHRESGQAAVESALVMPMMVFLVLGVIQLGMVHQARLMTEYAAYRAARAGIVNGGDCQTMKNSAYMALLPTLGPPPSGGVPGRTDTVWNLWSLYVAYVQTNPQLNQVYQIVPGPLDIVRVEVLNPRRSQLPQLFQTYGSHLNQREIDYDDVRDSTVVNANLLTVRVTYHYNMRIPFANWLIHSWFMGYELIDALEGVQFENQLIGGQTAFDVLEAAGAMRGDTPQQRKDFRSIAALATTRRIFVIPLVATWSMRMQSNLIRGDGNRFGVMQCAVDP